MNSLFATMFMRSIREGTVTLYADVSSRRPGFSDAARPDKAIPLYELVISECRKRGFHVETGEFGADMKVQSVNDGPVMIII